MLKTGRRSPQFGVEQKRPAPLDPEANPWWWNPGRTGVPSGPPTFTRQLEAIDPGLAITRNNFTHRWQIWMKSPQMAHRVCSGWKLLFPVDELSEHVFASLYKMSVRTYGSAKQYFDAIERELIRDRERKERSDRARTLDEAMPFWDHSRISVGGYGQSNGSKFSDYHA